MTLTEEFVRKVVEIEFSSLPAGLVELSKHVVLDGLAVMVAGAAEPSGLGRIAKDYVRAQGGHPQASVITGGFKTSVTNAAYANGCLAHALDFDNTWYPTNHPTSPTLPAILAIAQHRGLGGRRVIEALVTAFEVQARVRLAASGMTTGHGFHKPGTTGLMGATAAAVKLLGLSAAQAQMAFGLAGSRAGSLSINTGTMTKSSHAGHAARMGAECGLLAAMGWTATREIFGPGGFFEAFWGQDARPEKVLERFADPWRMLVPGVGFKKYPSNYFTHRPIDAALALRRTHDLCAEDIRAVRVRFPAILDYVDRPAPGSGLDGKFSVQYVTAVALLDGQVTMESFTDTRRFSGDAESLLEKITLTRDAGIPGELDDTYVDMEIERNDGRCFALRMEKLSGWCGNPLSEAERHAKYFQCVGPTLGKERADRVLALVDRLDRLEDIGEIMALVE